MALVSPASPMASAAEPGCCSARKRAVASALVQIALSGRSIPLTPRARRSLGVKIELLVSTRNGRPNCCRAAMNWGAPGRAASSWTSAVPHVGEPGMDRMGVESSGHGEVLPPEPRMPPGPGSEQAQTGTQITPEVTNRRRCAGDGRQAWRSHLW